MDETRFNAKFVIWFMLIWFLILNNNSQIVGQFIISVKSSIKLLSTLLIPISEEKFCPKHPLKILLN